MKATKQSSHLDFREIARTFAGYELPFEELAEADQSFVVCLELLLQETYLRGFQLGTLQPCLIISNN